jgi:hypothetical protein
MTDEIAPTCPISDGTLPYRRKFARGSAGLQGGATKFPGIPNAVDLPSLIRATNVMRDILRSLTSNLTVNNLFLPKQPFFKAQGDTYYSQYPAWDQIHQDVSQGWVNHKVSGGKIDPSQRCYVQRINIVEFQNSSQEDKEFKWNYKKEIK